MVVIKKHKGIYVLRDDLLLGGTKSVIMPYIVNDCSVDEWVYASPVYGGFQIALSAYCKQAGLMATIVTPERKKLHANTLKCMDYGAKLIEDRCGFLSGVQKKALDYCNKNSYRKRKLVEFGGKNKANIKKLSKRVKSVIKKLGFEPKEIWCAIGSGTLVESILCSTNNAKVFGVQVGKEYKGKHKRLTVFRYHKSFDKPSKFECSFPSTKNYDLKAWEYCLKYRKENKEVLFWNVL